MGSNSNERAINKMRKIPFFRKICMGVTDSSIRISTGSLIIGHLKNQYSVLFLQYK